MCRWITVISADCVSLSDVVLAPANSLVVQSKDASFHPGYDDFNNSMMNGDGFGVGWYHTNVAIYHHNPQADTNDGSRPIPSSVPMNGQHDPTPVVEVTNGGGEPEQQQPPLVATEPAVSAAIFKDIYPAWNNTNLRELCIATSSNCIMAHIRAASKNTGISHMNCHPFKAGRLLFCHNGRIDTFSKLRRSFLTHVTDEAFANIYGTTDSECIFAMVLTFLAQDGHNESPFAQKTQFGHKRMVNALRKTLRKIENLLKEAGMIDGYSTCNFALTDGDTMVATRYCDKSPDVPPPSLYFAFGHAKSLYEELTSQEQPAITPRHQLSHHDSSYDTGMSDTGSVDSDSHDDQDVMHHVTIGDQESRPGKQMVEVDPKTASFIVSSNPLTNTHTWHPMPRNSILWCTRGSHPELRIIRRSSKSLLS